MKRLSLLLLLLMLSLPSAADTNYSDQDLDRLVAPVALYPDPLLANVLIAASQPSQVLAAKRYVDAGNTLPDPPNTGWDSSVNALVSYPTVLTMMTDNTDWMKAIGWAAANQLTDVMNAVQRFRFQAQSAGNLKSDDKMTVITEGTTIRIEPATQQTVYVPVYDPDQITSSGSSDDFGTLLTYSAGIATNVLLWENVFGWNDYSFYRMPYGWYPPAAYWRPYGWHGLYTNANVWHPDRNVVVNRPVNIDNRTFNNINAGNRTLNSVNATRTRQTVQADRRTVQTNTRNSWVAPQSEPQLSRSAIDRQRPPVATPQWQEAETARRQATERTWQSSSSSLGAYSRSSTANRESLRGSRSLESRSLSTGAMRTGGFRGGGMRGGFRR